jgi:hypothetical protein
MPRLVERLNGTHFIRHYYGGNTTWQVDADGVLFLQSLGIGVGVLFSTNLFMVARTLGYLYTLSSPRVGPPKRFVGDEGLLESARGSYRAMFARDLETAASNSWLQRSGGISLAALTRKLGAKALGEVVRWKILNVYTVARTPEAGNDVSNYGLVYTNWQIMRAKAIITLKNRMDLWCKLSGTWYWAECGWTHGMFVPKESN